MARKVYGKCSVGDCDRDAVIKSRLMCNAHYLRERNGVDMDLPHSFRGARGCSVEGCDRSHYGRGYCQPHWYR